MTARRRGSNTAMSAALQGGSQAWSNADLDDLVPLGDGPVATVLAGVHESTGEAFALKVYPGKLDKRTQAELNAELSKLVSLRAQALVLVADRVDELPDGRCALRMELCAQSLPELVTAFGPLSIADTLALGQALAVTLAAVHGAGLVHGQVTPGNVLFRPSGEPVLSDFGLALRRAFPCDPLNAVDFLPPETIRDGTADVRADLYGLGVILYLSLTGYSPHRGRPGEQPNEQVLRVLSSAAPTLERADAPAGLLQLVSSLLSKNPDARPMDARSVANRLGSLLGPVLPDGPTPAPPPAPAPPPNEEPKTVTVFLPKPDRKPEPQSEAKPEQQPAPGAEAKPEPTAAREVNVASNGVIGSGRPAGTPVTDPNPQSPVAAKTEQVDTARQAEPKQQDVTPSADVTQKVSGITDRTVQLPIVRPWRPGQGTDARPPRSSGGFDDFSNPPGPRPAGDPILVYGPRQQRRWNPSLGLVVSAAGALALVVIAAMVLLLWLNQPDELAVPAPPSEVGLRSAPASEVELKLNTPTDLGDSVELSWHSNSAKLRYAVIVAATGQQQKTLLAMDGNKYRVPVDRTRLYCFTVQGTDGKRIYESKPVAIRGASCSQRN